MRKQDINRLKKLCQRCDDDIQAYDVEVYSYREVKRMILKKAGIKTAEIEKEEFEYWQSMAEYWDSLAIEDKVVVVGRPAEQKLPIYCLVLVVHRFHITLALRILNNKFKGNLHRFGVVRRKDKRGNPVGSAAVWIKGTRQTTQMIMDEFARHNLYYRVLRHYPFRQDYLHYNKGRFYNLPRSIMKQVRQKVSKLSR